MFQFVDILLLHVQVYLSFAVSNLLILFSESFILDIIFSSLEFSFAFFVFYFFVHLFVIFLSILSIVPVAL